jgi:DNA-directed RNA polymerase sigma subunit (sigma70/sigma32)
MSSSIAIAFRTSHDEMFTLERMSARTVLSRKVPSICASIRLAASYLGLTNGSRRIIINRFGLDHSQEPQTLKEVGHEMGVTKERVRQIEARALNKLRLLLRRSGSNCRRVTKTWFAPKPSASRSASIFLGFTICGPYSLASS